MHMSKRVSAQPWRMPTDSIDWQNLLSHATRDDNGGQQMDFEQAGSNWHTVCHRDILVQSTGDDAAM